MKRAVRDSYLSKFPEFLDVFKVLEFGRTKYGGNGDNWLAPDSKKMDHSSNCKSRSNHLLENAVDMHHRDRESGLPVLLHEACRALMEHTRLSRSIYHPADVPSNREDLNPQHILMLPKDLLYYLASPYTSYEKSIRKKKKQEHERYLEVTSLAARLIKHRELDLLLPITTSHGLKKVDPTLGGTWQVWAKTDSNMVRHSDVLLVAAMPGWDESVGVHGEIQVAMSIGIPIIMIDPITLATWRYI